MNHVCLKSLRKVYVDGEGQSIAAVNGVDLEVPAGQFLAVMGASGSGKTTLLHLIAGLTRPTAGEIWIGGEDITSMREHRLTLFRREHIGVIFQSFNLIPTLTAEENVLLPVLAGFRRISRRRVEDALGLLLERLKLTERRRHYPDTLSGGEQQRVAIARALLLDFASDTHGGVLLADEPTGNLDSVTSEAICGILQNLCREREHTMIVVTHEDAVARWADRIVTLKDGRLAGDAATGAAPV